MTMPDSVKGIIATCTIIALVILTRLLAVMSYAESQQKASVAVSYSTNWFCSTNIIAMDDKGTITNLVIGPIRITLTNGIPEKIAITDTPVAAFMVDGASANIVGKQIRVEMKP